MNSAHAKIRTWLESVFSDDDPVPDYEVGNSENLKILLQVAEVWQEGEKDREAANSLKRHVAHEYKMETDLIDAKLSALGLSLRHLAASDSASASSNPSFRCISVLAELSLLLDCDEPADDSLLLALCELKQQVAAIPADDVTISRDEEEYKDAKFNILKDISGLAKVKVSADSNYETKKESLAKMERDVHFLKEKQKDYLRIIDANKQELRKRGLTKDTQHESIVDLKQELTRLEEKLKLREIKLESYQVLPPDLQLAKIKLAEAQQELASLTHQLTSDISALHL